ncbi:MAG: phage integrase N-terminal SAM-like domain-containing protein [Proteobacteria bacterium]|nr:phage integrase N-terminal SAM-like domain-containing protein [Pseudomonadota bacterium]
MTPTEEKRFKKLYEHHLRSLKLQGKSQKTIDAYSRAVRRVSEHFDCCPDQLTPEQLEIYFADLVDSHSWSDMGSSLPLTLTTRTRVNGRLDPFIYG